ncbi:AgmX/PglI C-terminal domain-containing protein [Hyalangium minutum]|uniref:TonB C-terminal domain-containing protein n=1 Tax=Hyalangium minutum TaxID=394096 RepID=A0A085WK07_9BACT|nr:AgmX/PglI C-terminal domain-containing protein [Hyalangium minutum]KFE68020.1 hypothetical protein DB31_7257 [Hyalangium minutum]
MVENPTERTDPLSVQGAAWKEHHGSGVSGDVHEALDAELDAYLDRELSAQLPVEAKPAPETEKPAERLQSVLALAAEEEQWLRGKPAVEPSAENAQDIESTACEVPEHLRVKPEPELGPASPVDPSRLEAPWAPLPAPLPGLAMAPHLMQQGRNLPVAPAPAAPSRAPWLMVGALTGVSAASAFVAAMLWMTRDSLPDRAQVMAAYAPAGTVATVAAAAVLEPVLVVKDSPLPREPGRLVADWVSVANGTVEAVPGPVVPGRAVATREPTPPAPVPAPQAEPAAGAVAQAASIPEPKTSLEAASIAHAVPVPVPGAVVPGDKAGASVSRSPGPVGTSVKAEALPSREKVQARRAPAVEARRQLEDPSLEDAEEEELPVLQPPQETRAPVVAKAEPPPAPQSEADDGSEFDEEFARKLGFTKDAIQKKPESTRVKSVWVPPDPDANLPETLAPDDIQQVVIANQPAISSCIQRHKEAIPGLSGGKFMVRWFILPSGSTQQATMETKALKGTALATCVEDVVRGWKFPKHRTQMGAIRFPFIF